MNKYFYYFNPSCAEWTSSVSFAYDSTVIPLKAILMFELQQLSYYIQKLSEMGVNLESKKDKIIEFIAIVIINLSFRRNKFELIVKDLEKNKDTLEALYFQTCEEKNIPPEPLTETQIFGLNQRKSRELNISERESYLQNSFSNSDNKFFYEIIIKLVQSVCITITELNEYGISVERAKNDVIKILAKCNFINDEKEDWEKNISDFGHINYELNLKMSDVLNKKYGPVGRHDVRTNVVEGKCILVTGHFYKDLETVLEAAKELDINVYTHSDMLMAHAYEKFSQYPNLKGHYQRSYNNIQLDFASFPGPILITRNSIPHTELIRGQIYTVDNFSAFGFAKIENGDFAPLIEYAQNSAGFSKTMSETKISVGYNTDEIKARMLDLGEKFKRGEIKHIFVLGGLDRLQGQDTYFKNFMDKCDRECFVISFSYNFEKENLIHINSHYDFQLLWGMLERLNREWGLENYPVSVFITRCNAKTISTIFNLKALGIKNIYLPPCYPNVLTESIVEGLKKHFGIKVISKSAGEDITEILK